MKELVMQRNYATFSSKRKLNFSIISLPLIESSIYFSCHMLDEHHLYDGVLTDTSSTAYKLIKRLVKTIIKFAHNG